MDGWQLAAVLALCLALPVLCGALPACATSSKDVGSLCTFVAGGMIGLAQAQAHARTKDKAHKDATP